MTQASKRRWFSFSLRTMLIVVTVFACWLGWRVEHARDCARLLRDLNSRGAIVQTSTLSTGAIYWQDGSRGKKTTSWIWRLLGFGQIDQIFLADGHFTNTDVDHLEALFPEAHIYRCEKTVDEELRFFGYLRDPTGFEAPLSTAH
jgi:hypothetical protein